MMILCCAVPTRAGQTAGINDRLQRIAAEADHLRGELFAPFNLTDIFALDFEAGGQGLVGRVGPETVGSANRGTTTE